MTLIFASNSISACATALGLGAGPIDEYSPTHLFPNIAHLQVGLSIYLDSGSHEGTVMTVAGTEVGINLHQDLEIIIDETC